MLQLRNRDGRAYSPGRDISQLFPRIAQNACQLLAKSSWHPQIKAWAEHANLTQQDLEKAEIALAKYIAISTTDLAKTKTDAWVNSGLSVLHPAAQIMIFFFVGTVTTDIYLRGARESTRAGHTAHGAERLIDRVERLVHAQSAGLPHVAARRLDQVDVALDKQQSKDEFDS